MSSVRDTHEEAMKIAQRAMVARHRGQTEEAEQLARQAYKLEANAAAQVPDNESSEPSRSIMYLSAASLAYQGKEFIEALRLAAKGLSGYPSPQTRRDLMSLYAQVNFELHLQERGIELAEEDLEVDMHGQVVGAGMMIYSQFLGKIDALKTLMDRTTQRLMQRTYQRTGRVADIFKPFTPALSVPRPGSFAVTFRLAKDIHVPLLFSPADVIEEILTGIDLVNSGNQEGLRERIKQEGYYLNFVTLTKKVAPDGNLVDFVGLQSSRKHVELTRRPDDIELPPDAQLDVASVTRETVQFQGVLDYARSRGEGIIGLTTTQSERYYVHVREGMDDVVKSYFDDTVVVIGDREGEDIYLKDIRSAEVRSLP